MQRSRQSAPPSRFPPAELGRPLLAGLAALAASWGLLAFLPALHPWLGGDVDFYANWGSWLAGHRVPYRDFAFEYPPGVLPVLELPPYLEKIAGGYRFWFRVEILVFAALGLVAMAWALARLGASRRRAYAALVLAGLGPLLLGPISVSRYDYWPALFAVAGIAALVSGRGVLACALLAVGAVAKVWPIVLAPLALVELWRRRGARGAVEGLAAGLLVLVAGFAPFLALAPHGLSWAVERQASRPLQIESLGSAVFLAAHSVAGTHVHVVGSHGSDNVLAAGAGVVGTLSGVATALALLLVYVLYARGRSSGERLVLACAAAVASYVAFTKVFSPQYLVWLIPIVPLVGGRAGVRAGALLVGLLGLTQVWEPYRYHELTVTLAPWLVWLVVVRDLLALLLVWVLVRPLLASERDAEQLDPARAPLV
jgi:hypothetical protein